MLYVVGPWKLSICWNSSDGGWVPQEFNCHNLLISLDQQRQMEIVVEERFCQTDSPYARWDLYDQSKHQLTSGNLATEYSLHFCPCLIHIFVLHWLYLSDSSIISSMRAKSNCISFLELFTVLAVLVFEIHYIDLKERIKSEIVQAISINSLPS